MNCSGPCEQGRRPCPTPDACQKAEFVDSTVAPLVIVIILAGVLAGIAWRYFA